MINKIFKILYSTKTMVISLTVFAVAMAWATFIENDYGTPTAKAIIYNTKWFEILMFIMVVNFIGNVFIFRLYRKEKWPVFLFHIGFIVVLLGAFITRYYSFEGIMPIRESSKSSSIYSDKTYIKIRVDNNEIMKNYENEVLFSQKKMLFGLLGNNNFELNEEFGIKNPKPFSVSLTNFIAHAQEKFVPDKNGENYVHLVESGTGSRKDIFIKNGDIKSIRNILFTFNNPIQGGMNIFQNDKKNTIQPAFDGTVMEMKTQKLSSVTKDSVVPLLTNHLYSFGEMRFVVKDIAKGKIIKETAPKKEQDRYPYDALTLKIKSGNKEKTVEVRGTSGAIVKPEKISLNGLNFNISYGSKKIKTPFEIKLRDFEMQRYPGTNSASSYASEVTVLDKDHTFDFRIFMNHVLDHKGYRFYQASYDRDEKGTVLSVNHDYWGTLITYIGYILLGLGMFVSLFWNGTRFKKLSDKVNKLSRKKAIVLFLFVGLSFTGFAQEESKLNQFTVSKEHAEKFGHLLIQDHQGRIKPINTYALEDLRKVYKKDKYHGLTAEQVLLSAQLYPKFWSNQYIIKIKPLLLGKKMARDLKEKNGYVAMMNFFTKDGKYYLEDKVEDSFRKLKANRNATDKETIDLDERANVWWAMLNSSLMKIYPKQGEPNNKWFTGTDKNAFVARDTMVLKLHQNYFISLNNAVKTGDYKDADQYLKLISEYQKKIGKNIIPSDKKIGWEIKYNKWNIFKNLLFYYMTIGFIFLILAFVDLFKPYKKSVKLLLGLMTVLTMLGMVAHIFGMGLRWYVSGHEPWSNGYEAVIFVAFVTILAGLIFSYRKSKFALAASVLFASFLMGIAHGSMMNPEVTNLVPVLKSYWLMIHVAVITSSYGFLGLGSLLGLVVLILYTIRTKKNKEKINDTIAELTAINEMTLTVGLYTLTIGTFLGGVWANESWGRYWSWDPKEVWSLISMMVYVIILHMRIVPGLRGKFAFNVASFFAISSLIMTFFGVNHYLAGMHSYAKGDPVPIPTWISVAVTFFIILTIFSYWRYQQFKKSS